MEKPHLGVLANRPAQAHCQHQEKLQESYVNGSKNPASKVQTIYMRLKHQETENKSSLSSHALPLLATGTLDSNYHIMPLNFGISHYTAKGTDAEMFIDIGPPDS